MGLQDKIKERVDDAVVKSYYKSWHKRWWGRVLIAIAVVIALMILIFLFSFVEKYLNLKAGKQYDLDTRSWFTEDQVISNREELAHLLSEDDPWLGSDQPYVYVVSYESYGCPICQENQADIKKLISKYGSVVRYIRKDFPLEGTFPNVMEAHLAAACANEQGTYWEYSDMLYTNEDDFKKESLNQYARDLGLNVTQFSECLNSEKYVQEIKQDYAMGVKAGVVGTPTFVINGILRPGAIPIEMWDQIVGFIIKDELQ